MTTSRLTKEEHEARMVERARQHGRLIGDVHLAIIDLETGAPAQGLARLKAAKAREDAALKEWMEEDR